VLFENPVQGTNYRRNYFDISANLLIFNRLYTAYPMARTWKITISPKEIHYYCDEGEGAEKRALAFAKKRKAQIKEVK